MTYEPTTLGIIRPRPDYGLGLVDAAQSLGWAVADVCDVLDVRVSEINHAGKGGLFLQNRHVSECQIVVYLGPPALFHWARGEPSADQLYVQQELEESILAALALNKRIHLVNRSWVLLGNQLLLLPARQLRVLKDIGWQVPTVNWRFDFSQAESIKWRSPEPGQRAILIATRRRFWIEWLGQPPVEMPPEVQQHISATLRFLRRERLDWAVLPLAVSDDEWFAYGLSGDVSHGIPPALLREVLQASREELVDPAQ